jgi:hypothetical protein
MKITDKMISIPPYISATWDKVHHMQIVEDDILLIMLNNGYEANLTNLEPKVVNAIFAAYERWVERQNNPKILSELMKPPTMKGSFHIGNPEGGMVMEAGLPFQLPNGSPLEHNPDHRNFPDIPKEIVEKIAKVASIVAPADPDALPKAEPHCNCMFCQISRAISNGVGEKQEDRNKSSSFTDFSSPPPANQSELAFSALADTNGWSVQQSAEDPKLYIVVKEDELHEVVLGETIGCTCGQPHCEHIEAVLRS